MKENGNIKKIHAWISGRVQGVFYRATTKRRAKKLNLTGWVKNLEDGRVEVVAEGKKGDIDEFQSFLEKGPIGAKVKDMKLETEFLSERSYSSFTIER
mgnify:CR=1 FL=1